MGKFAGFWKCVKNFMFETVPNTIGKSMTNGIIKLNHVYKKYEPYIDAGIHLGLEAFGPVAGTLGGTVASLGLKRASKLADKLEWGNNHDNQFWSNYDNQQKYKDKNVIVVGSQARQEIPPKRDNNNTINNNKIQSRFNELKRINTNN